MIQLVVEPNTVPMSRDEFIKTKPARSIALDGYVATGPWFHEAGPHANFNHHEGVSRLETRATCSQCLIAVRQGLDDTFHDEFGNLDCTLFVNDCDEDVSTSVWIMRNRPIVAGAINPLLNKLVFIEDLIDTTAGAYPFPSDLDALQQLMWVFAPYHHFRTSGELHRRNAARFRDVIDDVGTRIDRFIVGKSGSVKLDFRFEQIGRGKNYDVVREIGLNARLGVFSHGIRAFVAAKERPCGTWAYTLGRQSQFVDFPIPRILRKLNEVESITDGDLWGGSDIVAGSPRIHGSKIPPEELVKIIDSVV